MEGTDRRPLIPISGVGYAFLMLKSHRIALKPTLDQESLFLQHAGYARFAYNWAVAEFQAGLEVGEWLGERSLRPRWNRVKAIMAPGALSCLRTPPSTPSSTWARHVRHGVNTGGR